jgi:hypothetical protein
MLIAKEQKLEFHYLNSAGTKKMTDEIENTPVLFADGFEGALLGIGRQFSLDIAVYDYSKCISILMEKQGFSYEDAVEWMEYNVVGAYVGKTTPIFLMDEEYSQILLDGGDEDGEAV